MSKVSLQQDSNLKANWNKGLTLLLFEQENDSGESRKRKIAAIVASIITVL